MPGSLSISRHSSKVQNRLLTDISMLRCDGFQLADAVQADPRLAAIQIVFVTGFAQKYDLEEADLDPV